ncbi:MAG: hypothetical protein ABSG31_03820 [Tepidisphaeraceae bacterium]|jgi:hypothetical protein
MFARFAPRGVCAGALSAVAAALVASSAFATTDTLTSGNSSLVYNLNSQTGNNSWVVDGVDQFGGSPAGEQWFWVSLNGAAPVSLDNWNLVSNVTATANTMTAEYAAPVVALPATIQPLVAIVPETLTITTVLSGGSAGSGASAINTTVTFQNNTDSTVSASIYDYVDANVNATPSNDTLTLSSLKNEANQTDPAGVDFNFSSTTANHDQVATDGSILTELNGGSPVTLSDNYVSPVTGNTSFAFEYDGSFTAGDSGQISINETLNKTAGSTVPMPSAAASALSVLAGLGLIGIIRRAKTLAVR